MGEDRKKENDQPEPRTDAGTGLIDRATESARKDVDLTSKETNSLFQQLTRSMSDTSSLVKEFGNFTLFSKEQIGDGKEKGPEKKLDKAEQEKQKVEKLSDAIKSGDNGAIDRALHEIGKSDNPGALVDKINKALQESKDGKGKDYSIHHSQIGGAGGNPKENLSVEHKGQTIARGEFPSKRSEDKAEQGDKQEQEKLDPSKLRENTKKLFDESLKETKLGKFDAQMNALMTGDATRKPDEKIKSQWDGVHNAQEKFQQAIDRNFDKLTEAAAKLLPPEQRNNPEKLADATKIHLNKILKSPDMNNPVDREISQAFQNWTKSLSDFSREHQNREVYPGDKPSGNGAKGAQGSQTVLEILDQINRPEGSKKAAVLAGGDGDRKPPDNKALVDGLAEKAKHKDDPTKPENKREGEESEKILAALASGKFTKIGDTNKGERELNVRPPERERADLQHQSAEALAKLAETQNLSKDTINSMLDTLKDGKADKEVQSALTTALGKQLERGNPALTEALRDSKGLSSETRKEIFEASRKHPESKDRASEGPAAKPRSASEMAWQLATGIGKGEKLSPNDRGAAYKNLSEQLAKEGQPGKATEYLNKAFEATGSTVRVSEESHRQHSDQKAVIFKDTADGRVVAAGAFTTTEAKSTGAAETKPRTADPAGGQVQSRQAPPTSENLFTPTSARSAAPAAGQSRSPADSIAAQPASGTPALERLAGTRGERLDLSLLGQLGVKPQLEQANGNYARFSEGRPVEVKVGDSKFTHDGKNWILEKNNQQSIFQGEVTADSKTGAITITDKDGIKTTHNRDGSKITYNKDDSSVTENTDKSKVHKDANRTVTQIDHASGATVKFENGKPVEINTKADGKWALKDGKWTHEQNGQKSAFNGSIDVDSKGNVTMTSDRSPFPTTYNTDGTKISHEVDRQFGLHTVVERPDGSKLHSDSLRNPGASMVEQANGNKVWMQDGKPVSVETKDGTWGTNDGGKTWSFMPPRDERMILQPRVWQPSTDNVTADEKGNVTVEHKGGGKTQYNNDGTKQVEDKDGTKRHFNKDNLPDKTEYPNGAKETYQYRKEVVGFPPKEQTVLDKKEATAGRPLVERDDKGNPTRIWDSAGNKMEVGYDDKGKPNQFTDKQGNQYTRKDSPDGKSEWVDAKGKKADISKVEVAKDGTVSLERTDRDKNKTSETYKPDGTYQILGTTARGESFKVEGKDGKPTEVTTPSGEKYTLGYDSNGELNRMSLGLTQYEKRPDGWYSSMLGGKPAGPLSMEAKVNERGDLSINTSLGSRGLPRITDEHKPDGSSYRVFYRSNGEATAVERKSGKDWAYSQQTNPDGSLVEERSDKNGTAMNIRAADGSRVEATYDKDNKLTSFKEIGKDGQPVNEFKRQGDKDEFVSKTGEVRRAVEINRDGDLKWISSDNVSHVKHHDGKPEGDLSKQRELLKETAEKRITNEADRARFLSDMKAFEERARKQGLSDQEIARTYQQIGRLLNAQDKDIPSATGPVRIPEADRIRLAEQVMRQAARPTSLDQGAYNTCNVTVAETRMYTTNPSEAARMVADVATTGSYTAGNGRTVQLDGESLKRASAGALNYPANENERTYASQLFQVTAVNLKWAEHNAQHGTNIRYAQHAGTNNDNGERLLDFSKRPPEEITGFDGAGRPQTGGFKKDKDGKPLLDQNLKPIPNDPIRNPALNTQDAINILGQISGKDQTGVAFMHDDHMPKSGLIFKTPADSRIVTFSSPEELARKLEEAQKAGRMPVIIEVNTGAGFLGQQVLAAARDADPNAHPGGVIEGGGHVLTVTKFTPAEKGPPPKPATVDIDNQWGASRDKKGAPVQELYDSTRATAEGRQLAAKNAEGAAKDLADRRSQYEAWCRDNKVSPDSRYPTADELRAWRSRR